MEFMIKKMMIGGLLCVGMLTSTSVLAARSGQCFATGGSHHSTLPFYGERISVTQNKAGATVNYQTSNSDKYAGTCECTTGTMGTKNNLYYTAEINEALTESATRSGVHYYGLDEYLDVGLSIEVYGRGYINAPFASKPNYPPGEYHCDTLAKGIQFDSGSSATIYFYIKEPFIGTVHIPTTLIARLYAAVDANTSLDQSQPLADVYIAGDITAPQECTINGGATIEVNFGKIPASEFSTTAGTAITSRKIPITASVNCTGMASG
jgi:type 1 fimbria pilin